MAPAGKVKALRCRDSFAGAARQVLGVRLDELEYRYSLISDPAEPQPLHDLRIAAKRLRYSLETFAVAFPGKEAEKFADRIRALQDILGRIHDLDVLEELLIGRIEQMDADGRTRGLEIARNTSDETARQTGLQQLVWGDQRHARIGLYSVIAAKADQRRAQYARFESLWAEWTETALLRSIRTMITGVAPDPEPEESDEDLPIPTTG
jgi:hypothetical protein